MNRLRNCAWTLSGFFRSRSVHLRRVAEKMPGAATTNSKIRRLSRVLDNPALQVRRWYEPLARSLLQAVVVHRLDVRLLLDGTKVGFGHPLLMVALAYRRRALLVAWTWVKGNRGHSSAYKQRALLAHVRRLLPSDAQVIVVGDSEFGAVPVLRQLEAWGWRYVLRQKSNHQVLVDGQATRQPFGTLIDQPRQQRWCPAALLTKKHAHPTKLLAHWQKGEKEPWLLATDLPTARDTVHANRRRMWLDEMFGDVKKNGFDLETSHLRHFLRLSRLTLMVAFPYLWLVTRGSQIIKSGQRRLVDRRDRRDLSIFRIGLSMIERHLAMLVRSQSVCYPTSCKLSGS